MKTLLSLIFVAITIAANAQNPVFPVASPPTSSLTTNRIPYASSAAGVLADSSKMVYNSTFGFQSVRANSSDYAGTIFTGGSANYSNGLRSGDSLFYVVFNNDSGSYLRANGFGLIDIRASGGTLQDNALNILNVTGGYSSASMYNPAHGTLTPATSSSLAVGYGPAGSGEYNGRCYIATAPRTVTSPTSAPPDLTISQEQNSGGGGFRAHRRIFCDGANQTIHLYGWSDSATEGPIGASVLPTGEVVFGAQGLSFHGSTTDAHKTYFNSEDATGTRTYRLRNAPTTSTLDVVAVLTKTDTGDPASGYEGQHVINTTDNTYKVYADGAWRQLATW